VAESDVDNKFCEAAANIIAGIVAKGKLKRNKNLIIKSFQSHARHFLAWNRTVFYSAPESGIRQIRSQICMTHVPETGAGEIGIDLRHWFLERVSWVLKITLQVHSGVN